MSGTPDDEETTESQPSAYGDGSVGEGRFGGTSPARETSDHPFLGDAGIGQGYLGTGDPTRGQADATTQATYAVGEYESLVSSLDPPGSAAARERLSEFLKTPFPVTPSAQPGDDEYTPWDAYLQTLGDEFERLSYARDETVLARYVETAQDGALDSLGALVDTPRQRDETDPHYRARLKLQLRVSIGGGTIADVKEAAAAILQTSPEAIRIDEPFGTEPARMDLSVQREDLDEAAVELDEFVEVLTDAKAAGVRLFGTLLGGFEHRSLADAENSVNDPEKGYAKSYATDEAGAVVSRSGGGEYSSLLYTPDAEVTL
ncbi:hypothetical protein [Halomarina oriensis]|uniref:Uncharacterized protein n=1 Tax=Halomarina oriensis TaxID=671145 RepID=A0A6B0GSA4_9EURY|nr:hypothetical protein [Halomarina oriensis]MWG36579.1 hypothetical protein [Halomarina oriensis]